MIRLGADARAFFHSVNNAASGPQRAGRAAATRLPPRLVDNL
jgi:hypothetical protein